MPDAGLSSSKPPPLYNRKNPYLAEILSAYSLTQPGSQKDTRHIVIGLGDSGIRYTPGDSLAIIARNAPPLVEALIARLGFPSEIEINDPRSAAKTLHQAFTEGYILNRASKKILHYLAERLPAGADLDRLKELLRDEVALAAYLFNHDYLDILQEFPQARFEHPEDFLAQLTPIPPRLYSIASACDAYPNEVHLCVGVVRWEFQGRKRAGLATGFLADYAELHRRNIPIYNQESRLFRLPADGSRDIIMVGPGTGIAPFRAFLQQRALEGSTGKNWLIFGEQHRQTDFFYEEEFQLFRKRGVLNRFDVAFSRDQAAKVYVQHRMMENARELWTWLKNGAYFYVCGDAHRMAKDVNNALIQIVQEEGALTPEAAAAYVNIQLMKSEKRYLRDVY